MARQLLEQLVADRTVDHLLHVRVVAEHERQIEHVEFGDERAHRPHADACDGKGAHLGLFDRFLFAAELHRRVHLDADAAAGGRFEPRDAGTHAPVSARRRRHSAIAVDTESVETKRDQIVNKSELVFDKVGDQYFLSQVWVVGTPTGSELAKSKMEKRLEDGGSQSEKHSVVAFLKQKR